jgi:hypothetical protein
VWWINYIFELAWYGNLKHIVLIDYSNLSGALIAIFLQLGSDVHYMNSESNALL